MVIWDLLGSHFGHWILDVFAEALIKLLEMQNTDGWFAALHFLPYLA